MFISFPRLLAIDHVTASGNSIRQLLAPVEAREGTLANYTRGRLAGHLFYPAGTSEQVLIIPKTRLDYGGHECVIEAALQPAQEVDLSEGKWLRHPSLGRPTQSIDFLAEIDSVLESWKGAFNYVQENQENHVVGLRPPQLGAVHRVHSHWTVSSRPGTIVMPTGTGKTETMLSVLVSAACRRLLVVVPTDALRSQLSEKFLTLGILKRRGSRVLAESAKYPIVCMLEHVPRDPREVDEICEHAQVIITTSSIAGLCAESVQDRLAHHCPYLFIDEAHHSEAPTWTAFRERFVDGRILQFTATPFREDGKPIEGEIIFEYPLKKAQEEGYFKPIRFRPVVAFDVRRADALIAAKAVEQLRDDADKGHILMARVESVARAKEVFEHYKSFTEFNPVQLHTGIKSVRRREELRQQIICGRSRIVVCVDMLGEGFDLPELKIAAFHDIRKSLAVTLQLAGRFTRARQDLGDATFIANTADVVVRDELRKLYERQPDWNLLLPELSERLVGEQVALQEFLSGFTEFTNEIPLKTVQPATSMVAYRTSCHRWTPSKFREGIPAIQNCEQVHHAINQRNNTLVVVTARKVPLMWTNVQTLFSWEWELYVVIWSPEQNLLYINSSANSGEYKALAHAVVGDSASLIKGQQVFRAFAGVNRLRLQNVGLTEQLGKNVRYTGSMGSDVGPGIPDTRRHRAQKSVLSGTGFEGGEQTTVGASRKGRIWSHRRERVDRLLAWCKKIGTKLLDENIDPDEVLKGTLEAQTIVVRPAKFPICVDWPEQIYTTPESMWTILIENQAFGVDQLSLQLVSPNTEGPLRFAIISDSASAECELELFGDDENPNYRFRSDKTVTIRRGSRADAEDISDFFYEAPPILWFADGSSLEGNQYVELKIQQPPFDSAKIQAWKWDGVNIRKESQGPEKAGDSIQAAVIRKLRDDNFHMIVDDDSAGEAADVVAIRIVGEFESPQCVEVEFYHCKYSVDDSPGHRVKDLYEVCGQAQKSVHWMASPEKRTDLFTHLLKREEKRVTQRNISRYELGDGDLLHSIREISRICPVMLRINIVQPGVSKAEISQDQLRLLGVTENYLFETYQLSFGVIASD